MHVYENAYQQGKFKLSEKQRLNMRVSIKPDYEKDETAMLKLCNPKHKIKTLFKIKVV
jgi:hypothetical protein